MKWVVIVNTIDGLTIVHKTAVKTSATWYAWHLRNKGYLRVTVKEYDPSDPHGWGHGVY